MNSESFGWQEEKNQLLAQINEAKALSEKIIVNEIAAEQKRSVSAELEETLASLRVAQHTIRQQDALIRQGMIHAILGSLAIIHFAIALFGKLPSFAAIDGSHLADEDIENNVENIKPSSRVLRSATKAKKSATTSATDKKKKGKCASFASFAKKPLDVDRMMQEFLLPGRLLVLYDCLVII